MKRVWLIQMLCPLRHAIMAAPFVDDAENPVLAEETQAKLQAQFDEFVASGAVNRKCELCGSTEFHFEVGRTAWSTLEEAIPHLRKCEADQLATQRLMRRSRN